MASKILDVSKGLEHLSEIRSKRTQIVLTGGCFDIIHAGHVNFLEKAKKEGDFLVVLLEGDENVRRLKGEDRPKNSQPERALNLSKIPFIDLVVLLPEMTGDEDYDKLATQIKPAIIAATKGDSNSVHKIRQAKLVGAKFREVIDRIPGLSTTSLLKRNKNG